MRKKNESGGREESDKKDRATEERRAIRKEREREREGEREGERDGREDSDKKDGEMGSGREMDGSNESAKRRERRTDERESI
jgi:hypothetical protein